MIPFNRPACTEREIARVTEALKSHKVGPGGRFSKACQTWLTDKFNAPLALPTGSCTAALEIAAMLLDMTPGDEVIMPSFGYPSTANAVVRAGGTPVFVDVEPTTMNIDADAAARAITPKTRAIIPIHYGGVSADMDPILRLAQDHDLDIIEDAANGFLAKYKDRKCGTMGRFGCFSFHETKAVHCGQGGALLINDPADIARAEILLEKGTDRRQFVRGEMDRYTWRDLGSSYALDDLRASFLYAQFEAADDITKARVAVWQRYHDALSDLADQGHIQIPTVPNYADINGMIFWLKTRNGDQRNALIAALADNGSHAVFHYIPLHSAEAGQRFGRLDGEDIHTTDGAARLLRLPIFHGLDEIDVTVDTVRAFFDAT